MSKPKTESLVDALQKLESARDAFTQAFEEVISTLDMSPVQKALEEWRKAAEVFQDEARGVYDAVSAYYDERSEKWQESDKGQAFSDWMGEVEALSDFDHSATDSVRILIDISDEIPAAEVEDDPSAAFPELPEIPEMGE